MFMKNVLNINNRNAKLIGVYISQKHKSKIKEIKWNDIKNIKR